MSARERWREIEGDMFVVDGHEFDDLESSLAGDGMFAPFYIFDVERQDYLRDVRGHLRQYSTLDAAIEDLHKYERKLDDSEYVCFTWFERDRANVRLETPSGREIFSLWDEAVGEAIEDGFLPTPRHPRPSDADWQPCAVEYARSKGLID